MKEYYDNVDIGNVIGEDDDGNDGGDGIQGQRNNIVVIDNKKYIYT